MNEALCSNIVLLLEYFPCFRFHIPGALWVEYNEIGNYYYDRNFNFTRSRNSRGYLKLSSDRIPSQF